MLGVSIYVYKFTLNYLYLLREETVIKNKNVIFLHRFKCLKIINLIYVFLQKPNIIGIPFNSI